MSVRNVWKHKRRICNLILGLTGVNPAGPKTVIQKGHAVLRSIEMGRCFESGAQFREHNPCQDTCKQGKDARIVRLNLSLSQFVFV